MNQAVKDIASTIDKRGNKDKDEDKSVFEVFVIVQRGLDIGFFEYYNGVSDLDEEGIDHFRGCVSLTQDTREYETRVMNPAVVPSTTVGLKRLMLDDQRLQGVADDEQEVRDDASSYPTPCIFNIDEHEHEINLMMLHMITKEPRKAPRARLQEGLRRNQRKSKKRLRKSLCL